LKEARKAFADLLKQWNLSAAEADQFLEAVAQSDGADDIDALAMFASGKIDGEAIAAQEAKTEAGKAESEKRLKNLLGESRYAEFEAANTRRKEMEAVSAYRDHLESAGVPLSDDQRNELARIVKAHKPDENDWHPEDVEFFTKGMTDAQLAKIRQREEAARNKIAQQAASFLSPDQVQALQAAFRAELDEQDLGLKFARNLIQGAAPAAK
jgi:hypothetical protein